MKIPFDVKFRPQIESGEYRVETKAGCPVRIVCWDMACELPILGLVLLNDEKAEEMAVGFTNEGTNLLGEPLYDKLFIVTSEPELNKFENRLAEIMDYTRCNKQNVSVEEIVDDAKRLSKELIELARKELHEELQTHEDHVNSFMGSAISSAYERGKAEALKDLPRWKKADRDWDAGTIDFAVFHKNDGGYHEDWLSVEVTNRLYKGEYYIELSDLEKLPKED